MKIDFITKKYELTNSFQEFAKKRLKKFEKYLDDSSELRVVLEEQKSNCRVEMHVVFHGDSFNANSSGQEMREAFMDTLHKLDVQLEKKKKKLKDRKRREAHRMESQWQMNVISRGGKSRESKSQIVTTNRLEIGTMDLDQALTMLEKSNDDFFLFRDDAVGTVRFLYRRKDGNFNLIIPE